MKKSKILAPALAMLCLSTAATVAGTVAWFSANTVVTVDAYKITAKSDATDLQVSHSATGNYNSTAKTNDWGSTIDDSDDEKKILPCAHESSGYISSGAVVEAQWYYGYSASTSAATLVSDTKQTLAAEHTAQDEDWDLANYVVQLDYYFRLAADTDKVGSDLHISYLSLPHMDPEDDTSAYTGITVLAVAGGAAKVEYAADYDETAENAATPVTLIDEIAYVADTGTSTYKVSLFIFVDGNHTSVTTDNIASLTGNIEVKFSITPETKSASNGD